MKYLGVNASTVGSDGGVDSTARASPLGLIAEKIYWEIDDT
ncbi:MAG: hypothetical protein P8L78_01720 [Mariniblastus sp.]|nr:hypothetical protein [Mariniblastus sp.]MDG2180382.1 hypothetical protein [Mariniblastus sp.]